MKRKLIKRNKHKLSFQYNFFTYLHLELKYPSSVVQTNLDCVYFWSSTRCVVHVKRFKYTRRHRVPTVSYKNHHSRAFGIPEEVPKVRNQILGVYLHEEKVNKKK